MRFCSRPLLSVPIYSRLMAQQGPAFSAGTLHGFLVLRSREAACASQVCACRLDEGVERGCILLDHVQQHNLHLAALEKYDFRSACFCTSELPYTMSCRLSLGLQRCCTFWLSPHDI